MGTSVDYEPGKEVDVYSHWLLVMFGGFTVVGVTFNQSKYLDIASVINLPRCSFIPRFVIYPLGCRTMRADVFTTRSP